MLYGQRDFELGKFMEAVNSSRETVGHAASSRCRLEGLSARLFPPQYAGVQHHLVWRSPDDSHNVVALIGAELTDDKVTVVTPLNATYKMRVLRRLGGRVICDCDVEHCRTHGLPHLFVADSIDCPHKRQARAALWVASREAMLVKVAQVGLARCLSDLRVHFALGETYYGQVDPSRLTTTDVIELTGGNEQKVRRYCPQELRPSYLLGKNYR